MVRYTYIQLNVQLRRAGRPHRAQLRPVLSGTRPSHQALQQRFELSSFLEGIRGIHAWPLSLSNRSPSHERLDLANITIGFTTTVGKRDGDSSLGRTGGVGTIHSSQSVGHLPLLETLAPLRPVVTTWCHDRDTADKRDSGTAPYLEIQNYEVPEQVGLVPGRALIELTKVPQGSTEWTLAGLEAT